ncbi:MAG: caspase family protein [Candidatus ainarchaeum sp.]|nr:caspase family protein [Candidatus ainarchaeum sp.]
MKKALIVGINDYSFGRLDCSVNDAIAINDLLSRHSNGEKNFHTKLLLNNDATKYNLLESLAELLFDETMDTVLFYFSGHGFDNDLDGSIVTFDATNTEPGIRMTDILKYINQSKINNKIIILDCCYSGKFGNPGIIGDCSILPEGTTILTASGKKQTAFEINGHGVFTNLLIEALKGGASDILGRVTPGSVYSYIDQALSNWEQRPIFKTNVSRFVVLRKNEEKIGCEIIRKLTELFPSKDFEFPLDPSFEPTNTENSVHYHHEPYAQPEKVTIFEMLQQYNRQGLVIPFDSKHMYYAAMESKGCKLTSLGKHYWNLTKKDII